MGAGRVIGNLGRKALGGIKNAQIHAGVKAEHYAGEVNRAVRGSVIQKEEAGFLNGYTGYKAGWATNAGAVALGVGVVGATTVFSGAAKGFGIQGMPGLEGIQTRSQTVGEISYADAPSIMSADGVGTATSAPNLGATGDLVFGLHNGRRS